MTERHSECFPASRRLRTSREYALVKASATAFRGRHLLVLVMAYAGEPTRVGFIASSRGVGGAVKRNRARRRLREIVRRRWARIPAEGFWLVFIAGRGTLTATHQELATEVERLLAQAGALSPIDDTKGTRSCAPSRSS